MNTYNGYSYGGYPANGYYTPPMPDQLAQLRGGGQFSQPVIPTNGMQQMSNQGMNNFQIPQPQTSPIQQGSSRIWVSSRKEVDDYLVAPNCSVDLWLDTGTVMFVKQADSSGKPTIKVYDVIERTGTPQNAPQSQECNYVTRDEWAALSARVDALTAKAEPKSRKSNAKENDE